MKIQRRYLWVAVTLWLVILADPVLSCMCAETPLEDSYKSATVVFAGYPTVARLATVSPMGSRKRETVMYTFRVEKWWKGGRGDTITVRSGRDSCEVNFVVGARYIVFAKGTPFDLHTGLCSGNRHSNGEDTAVLNWLAKRKE